MKNVSLIFRSLSRVLMLAVPLMLSACGGGGGSNTSNPGEVESVFSGSVGDGPIVGATVKVYDKDHNLIQTVISDASANYSTRIKTPESSYPLTIEVEDGTDLVTGLIPDFKLVSVVLNPSANYVNINPFSTLIVEAARTAPGGLSEESVSMAHSAVMSELNFGLDPLIVADPISTQVTDSNAASLVKASEVMGEMIRRVRDQMMISGAAVDGNDIVAALADDVADGTVDGVGSKRASPRVSAVSKIVSAQVLIEALSNNLKVQGVVATSRLDDAIAIIRPAAGSDQLTGNVRINRKMLEQARKSLGAARALVPSIELSSISGILDTIQENSLPSDVEQVLPGDTSIDLDPMITNAVLATDEGLAEVNNAGQEQPPVQQPPVQQPPVQQPPVQQPPVQQPPVQQPPVQQPPVQQPPVVDIPSNTAPTISGSPATSVVEGSSYAFQPGAFDANGDKLTFNISNRPSWAGFNSSTGRLSGTPAQGDAGIYGNIIISVSDGSGSAALPAFSIRVDAASVANSLPVINGTPTGAVVVGNSYSFQPNATDADGDSLTFSISNKPNWASFDIATGRLSGTPTDADTGIYGNILILVTDGVGVVSLPGFSIQVDFAQTQTGSFSLSWTAPVSRADGTALSLSDIVGYRIYYGVSPGNYSNSIDVANVTQTNAVINVPLGTYYVVMTTRDTGGRESGYSQVITKVAQ